MFLPRRTEGTQQNTGDVTAWRTRGEPQNCVYMIKLDN